MCCVLFRMPEAVEGVLCLLEVLEVTRCMMLRMPEAVEGVCYALERRTGKAVGQTAWNERGVIPSESIASK